jgi:16S rRNA (adenine1518-N6/adenine1519-N6)-dimethyltransferase
MNVYIELDPLMSRELPGRAPRAKKRFGQNFLTNPDIIARIVQVVRPQPSDHMIEIGPGRGAMTYALIEKLSQLSVVEIDDAIIPYLKEHCVCPEKLQVYHADALAFDFAQTFPDVTLRLVGNLPYNISSPLLFHFLSFSEKIKDMHVMLQKEVVDRIVAGPGSKIYGRLSVMLQYYCHVEKLFTVPPCSFSPQPKVDSAILRLITKQQRPLDKAQEGIFAQVVKMSFSQRRKTLRNNLKPFKDTLCFDAAKVDASARAETLTVDDFVRLTQQLNTEN